MLAGIDCAGIAIIALAVSATLSTFIEPVTVCKMCILGIGSDIDHNAVAQLFIKVADIHFALRRRSDRCAGLRCDDCRAAAD